MDMSTDSLNNTGTKSTKSQPPKSPRARPNTNNNSKSRSRGLEDELPSGNDNDSTLWNFHESEESTEGDA